MTVSCRKKRGTENELIKYFQKVVGVPVRTIRVAAKAGGELIGHLCESEGGQTGRQE